ncbi:Uncharacterized protein P3T76_003596 [Phytophthora citrophthora]|uniref:Uncharacterized protein n=1 Tax=Phytophthora citrophthora TaxID=4793 RepID=A0AAD9GVW9_9STRA|nr:Uncharacterized protein P3T76_003596 [Phytophthora citrophthora]
MSLLGGASYTSRAGRHSLLERDSVDRLVDRLDVRLVVRLVDRFYLRANPHDYDLARKAALAAAEQKDNNRRADDQPDQDPQEGHQQDPDLEFNYIPEDEQQDQQNHQPNYQPNCQPNVQPNYQPNYQPIYQPNVQPNYQDVSRNRVWMRFLDVGYVFMIISPLPRERHIALEAPRPRCQSWSVTGVKNFHPAKGPELRVSRSRML